MFLFIIIIVAGIAIAGIALLTSGGGRITRAMINSPSEQTVRDYIDDLEGQWFINNKPSVWDTYRAHFELVANSPNVPIELKRELRNALLKKGVSRLVRID